MKKILYTLIGILSFHFTIAQCGTDAYNYDLVKDKLAEGENYVDFIERDFNYQYQESSDDLKNKKAIRTIPVVFHVIHAYGEENISKEQILDQMRIINEDFQRKNSDASKTRTFFQGRATDMEVEFKLARVAPDGSCTEGITRTYDPVNTIEDRTDNDQEAKAAVTVWDPTKYMNVWVVKNIENGVEGQRILGYAQFPGQGTSTDGIVMVHDHLGGIGTSSAANAGRTLTHEIGHWLGLYHPFQGSGGSSGCFGRGDRVDDTPPVAEPSYGCTGSQNPNTCSGDFPDEVDNIENFMDYANGNCMNMFTNGQKTRMNSYLASFSLRGNVISSQNLSVTGVNTNPTCAPIADFWYGREQKEICAGESMTFEGLSYNGDVTTRTWTFEGGTPAMSSDQNPSIVYNTPGVYKVELEVSNATGSDKITKTSFVTVKPAISELKTPYSDDFSTEIDGWDLQYDGETGWRRNIARGFSGNNCLQMIIDQNSPTATRYSAIMAPIDMTTNTGEPKLHFKYAYAQRSSSTTEVLQILVSDNCQQSWKSIVGYNRGNLSTAGISAGWRPSSTDDWAAKEIDLSSYSDAENLYIRFDVISNAGNSVFIDDINLGSYALSVDENFTHLKFDLVPNPAQNLIEVRLAQNVNQGNVSIVDITGRLLLQQPITSSSEQINTSELTNGVYTVIVNSEGRMWTKKLIISK